MATIHTFTCNEVIATEVPKYLNDNFSALNTETANLSKSVVKTINSKSPVNGNINITGFDSYWEANEQVSVGEIRFPTGRDNSGIVLECVQTGTTGNTMPTIPNVVGMGLTSLELQTVLQAIEQVQTGLNGVESKLPTGMTDYIVESYRSGSQWYEVYKSGKVRQGAIVSRGSDNMFTYTFLKSFANTNYLAFAFPSEGLGSNLWWGMGIDSGNRSKTQMKVTFEGDVETPSKMCIIAEGQGA